MRSSHVYFPTSTFTGLAGMARRLKKASVGSRKRQRVAPSARNVFADLRFPDADELQTKVHLAFGINRAIARLQISPAEVARKLSLKRQQVAAFKAYRLDGFSVHALLRFWTILSRRSSGLGTSRVQEVSRRLAALGGTAPSLQPVPRRRSRPRS